MERKQDPQLKVMKDLIAYHQAMQTQERPFNQDREHFIQMLVAAHLMLQQIIRKEARHAA